MKWLKNLDFSKEFGRKSKGLSSLFSSSQQTFYFGFFRTEVFFFKKGTVIYTSTGLCDHFADDVMCDRYSAHVSDPGPSKGLCRKLVARPLILFLWVLRRTWCSSWQLIRPSLFCFWSCGVHLQHRYCKIQRCPNHMTIVWWW